MHFLRLYQTRICHLAPLIFCRIVATMFPTSFKSIRRQLNEIDLVIGTDYFCAYFLRVRRQAETALELRRSEYKFGIELVVSIDGDVVIVGQCRDTEADRRPAVDHRQRDRRNLERTGHVVEAAVNVQKNERDERESELRGPG